MNMGDFLGVKQRLRIERKANDVFSSETEKADYEMLKRNYYYPFVCWMIKVISTMSYIKTNKTVRLAIEFTFHESIC